MKNLGRLLFIILFLPNYIYALATASVDSKVVSLGDTVTLSISLEGKDIQRPVVHTLCGENIISTSSSTNIKAINGVYKKEYILAYRFIPTQTCTIEPIEISMNGKIEKTLAIDIKVEKVVAGKDAKFSLEVLSDKDEVYIGEPFKLQLVYKQDKSVQVVENKFTPPSFNGFWIKGQPTQSLEESAEFAITTLTYQLASQRAGSLEISGANIKIAKRQNKKDYWGGFVPEVTWKTIFSNDLNITSKSLPKGVDLVGDFTLEALVDKTEANPNEAVNITVKLIGDGNLEDVKSFKPYLDGVSIFGEKIVIEQNTLSQKMTFVGDSSFTIPVFSLKTFNIKTKEVKTITTKPISIHIKNAKQKEELIIQKEELDLKQTTEVVLQELNKLYIVIALFVGIGIGILIMLVRPFIFLKTKQKLDVKDTKVLLVKLMPYKDDEEVQKIIFILEGNLYSNEKIEVDKRVLKKIIKKYEII